MQKLIGRKLRLFGHITQNAQQQKEQSTRWLTSSQGNLFQNACFIHGPSEFSMFEQMNRYYYYFIIYYYFIVYCL